MSQLEAAGADEVAKLKENETRLQLRVQEAQRRENVLNMRLATKQQETQEIMVDTSLSSHGLRSIHCIIISVICMHLSSNVVDVYKTISKADL